MFGFRRLILVTAAVLGMAAPARAQTLDVTFRYIPGPEGAFVRAYVPGDFNGWDVAVNSPSQMTRVDSLEQYVYSHSFPVGTTTEYKINLHRNTNGTDVTWLSDPLNDRTNPQDNNNSVLTVADPMLFQLAREENEAGEIYAVSAGLFASRAITAVTYTINGVERAGMPFYNSESGIFRVELDEPVPAGSQFGIEAVDAASNIVEASVGVVPPTVVDAPRPGGVEDGITYHGPPNTSVTFSLFAPGKSFVHLIGDFNDWEASDDYLMFRDAPRSDSVHWWITVDELPQGELAYQYLVDGELRIADPFSEKVLDPVNDPHIPSTTYPDLKPYPTGKTQHIVSVFDAGTGLMPTAFVPWQDRPPQDELVVYELLLRDFLARHDFATLIDTLGYLERLGVNAIELMPVSEFSGNSSWGYNPTFAFAVDKYYGPAGDLWNLVQAAHDRGMAVILDVVYNHQADESPLVRLYGPTNDNPFINVPARHDFNVFFDLNHENTYIQYWLDRANAHWLREFGIDGYRFDLSKGFMQTGSFHGYNASRIELLKRMADRIWQVDSTAYVILEHFGDTREENELVQYGIDRGLPGMMVWAKETDPYNEATMGYHDGGKSNFSDVYHENRGLSVPHGIGFMESHDEQRLMYKNLQFGASLGDYSVKDLPVALDRMKAAGAFFFTVPGPKMVWQFGELGYEVGIEVNGRTGEKPIRWSYADDPLRDKLFKTWAALIELRNEHEVFRSDETEVTMNVSGALKTMYLSHPTMDVSLVGNFNVGDWLDATARFEKSGWWYDFFNGDSLFIPGESGSAYVSARPGEFHLFTSERVDFPPPGLITVDSKTPPSLPQTLTLHQNYPNPFNPSTNITYSLPAAGRVTLEVFDLLGRRVAVLIDTTQPAGTHEIVFDARNLPSGTYVARLTAAATTQTRLLILTK